MNILDTLHIPHNASLFTYDAISMYTNIDTVDCIDRLSDYLHSPETWFSFKHYTPEALIEAIKLVMCNNRMKFGDVFVCKVAGIAMGMSLAPTIANLYVAIYEQCHLLKYLETSLFFLKHFIDDGIGIWLHNADPDTDKHNWQEFKAMVNGSGIPWTFSPCSQQITFMDITILIENGKLITKLFKKPLALQLYIPPHSCHPPGVITELIMGDFLLIFCVYF